MSRPTRRDEAVIREAAANSLDEFRQWLGDDSTQYTDEELLKDLCDAIRLADDGYARARHLQDYRGYSPDAQLVDFLDDVDVWRAERRAVAKWVKEFDVKPPFPIGSTVLVTVMAEECIGEITNHDEELGLATVFCAAKGHVKDGLGTHGFLITWEKLKLAEEFAA